MAPNFKVNPALTKWWKSYVYTYGLRTQVQSPYRMDHLTPFVKHWPDSFRKKITENFFDVAPSFVFLVGTMWWADHAFEQEQRKHWS
jgi:hypothetical protein